MAGMRLLDAELWTGRIPLVRPFKFGMVELRELEHLVVRALVVMDGHSVWGMAGENLVPKWFEKVAGRPLDQDVAELRGVIKRVAALALAAGGLDATSPADFAQRLSALAAEAMPNVPGLVRQLATSLFERAVLNASLRNTRGNFWTLVNSTPPPATAKLRVRHTVGMADELSELPEILSRTGITRLKVKLVGDPEKDQIRLAEIMSAAGNVIDRLTVDGNENYSSVAALRDFLHRLRTTPALAPARQVLAWVEQPMRRDLALSEEMRSLLTDFADIPQVIDESDAGPADLPRALDLGYAGTTHKNCKGVFKSVRARDRLAEHRARTGRLTIFSGEDLTIVAPWSQAADLAVAAAVGVVDVERNGQHYAEGLSAFVAEVGDEAVRVHPELYSRGEDGVVRLVIKEGSVDCSGVCRGPLGWAGAAEVPAGFAQVA